MKKKAPSIGKFIDEKEIALHTLIESDSHVPGPSLLSPERLKDLRKSTTQQRYILAELLVASDYSRPLLLEEQAWVNGAALGREIL